jgi:hypothetical protein
VPSEKATYFGRAGEYAAMSEFLLRGWNVAVPVVDVGDDAFVINDDDKATLRVQVKSAHATRVDGTSLVKAHFTLSRTQLRADEQIELVYVFMVREAERWRFLVIPRQRLAEIHARYVVAPRTGPGRPRKSHELAKVDELGFDVTIDGKTATGWSSLLTEYLEAWPAELGPLTTGR